MVHAAADLARYWAEAESFFTHGSSAGPPEEHLTETSGPGENVCLLGYTVFISSSNGTNVNVGYPFKIWCIAEFSSK